MSKSHASYVASVGKEDEDRLAIQHECFEKGTEDFIDRLNIINGMKILIIGCGAGDETLLFAKRIGQSGSITAIDISEEQINVAKDKAERTGITNITFKTLAAENLMEIKDEFDVAYCRMVLVHIQYPKLILTLMLDRVKKNGIVACEEPDISTCFSIPKSEAFEKHISLLCEFIRKRNCDPDLGSKTYGMFKEIGFSTININFFQPAITDKRLKSAASMSAKSCGPQYIALGLATENEVKDLVSQIQHDLENQDSLLGQCRMTQIYGRK